MFRWGGFPPSLWYVRGVSDLAVCWQLLAIHVSGGGGACHCCHCCHGFCCCCPLVLVLILPLLPLLLVCACCCCLRCCWCHRRRRFALWGGVVIVASHRRQNPGLGCPLLLPRQRPRPATPGGQGVAPRASSPATRGERGGAPGRCPEEVPRGGAPSGYSRTPIRGRVAAPGPPRLGAGGLRLVRPLQRPVASEEVPRGGAPRRCPEWLLAVLGRVLTPPKGSDIRV